MLHLQVSFLISRSFQLCNTKLSFSYQLIYLLPKNSSKIRLLAYKLLSYSKDSPDAL